MSKTYSDLRIDQEMFNLTKDDKAFRIPSLERYNIIVNKIDGICPETFSVLLKINLIRIANIHCIITSLKSKRRSAGLRIPIVEAVRLEVPQISIKIVGKTNLNEDISASSSKYDCFNEFYNFIDESNSHSIEIDSEIFFKYREEEKKKEKEMEQLLINSEMRRNSDRYSDNTTEDDIIRAIQSGNGDKYGY